MTTVSVIIPAYNAERYVARAIDSALQQTLRDTEVIVVDDGSTDRTSEILARYEGRIRVIRQANGGTAQASNNAVSVASGLWIAFLDADDEWLPTKLQKQIEYCANYKISHTDSICFGEGLPREIIRSEISRLHEGQVLRQLLIANFIIKSSVMIWKDLFIEAGGFPSQHEAVDDWPLWLKVCAEHELGFVPEPLVRYRVHRASKSMNARSTLGAHLAIIDEAFSPSGVGYHLRELRVQALASSYRINGHYAATSSDWQFAIFCALRAVRFAPMTVETWKILVKSALIPAGVPY